MQTVGRGCISDPAPALRVYMPDLKRRGDFDTDAAFAEYDDQVVRWSSFGLVSRKDARIQLRKLAHSLGAAASGYYDRTQVSHRPWFCAWHLPLEDLCLSAGTKRQCNFAALCISPQDSAKEHGLDLTQTVSQNGRYFKLTLATTARIVPADLVAAKQALLTRTLAASVQELRQTAHRVYSFAAGQAALSEHAAAIVAHSTGPHGPHHVATTRRLGGAPFKSLTIEVQTQGVVLLPNLFNGYAFTHTVLPLNNWEAFVRDAVDLLFVQSVPCLGVDMQAYIERNDNAKQRGAWCRTDAALPYYRKTVSSHGGQGTCLGLCDKTPRAKQDKYYNCSKCAQAKSR